LKVISSGEIGAFVHFRPILIEDLGES